MSKNPAEVGKSVFNSKKNEGGGGSDFKKMEKGKEWSTDIQNKLRDKLKADIEKQTLNLKKEIPFREVKRGDTLIAVIAGMRKGGALEKIKNINNLKVKFGEKEFKNMFVELPDIRVGQKIWVEDGKIRVADEMPGKVVAEKVKTPAKKQKKEKSVEINIAKETENPVQSDLGKAMAELTAELKNQNPNLEKLIELRVAVKKAKVRNSQLTEIKKDPLAVANKIIAKLREQKEETAQKQKEAKLAKKVEEAEGAVKKLEELLSKNLTVKNNSAEIQNLIDNLKSQNKLVGEKVGELEDSVPKLKTKLDGLQNKIVSRLEELNLILEVAEKRENALRIEKEKAEKLKNKIAVNKKKLESLNKVSEGNNSLLNLINSALAEINVWSAVLEKGLLAGDININKDSNFVILPNYREPSSSTNGMSSDVTSVKGAHSDEFNDVFSLSVKRESKTGMGRDAEFGFNTDYLNGAGVADETVVRYWQGEERAIFWRLNNDVMPSEEHQIKLIARVIFKNEKQSRFIQASENGKIFDMKGKEIDSKDLKNQLRGEDAAEINKLVSGFRI